MWENGDSRLECLGNKTWHLLASFLVYNSISESLAVIYIDIYGITP